MGRYPGSSTTLRPTPDGTKWDSGNPHDYSDDNERKIRVSISKAERPVGRSKSPGYGHLKLPHPIIAVSAAEQR